MINKEPDTLSLPLSTFPSLYLPLSLSLFYLSLPLHLSLPLSPSLSVPFPLFISLSLSPSLPLPLLSFSPSPSPSLPLPLSLSLSLSLYLSSSQRGWMAPRRMCDHYLCASSDVAQLILVPVGADVVLQPLTRRICATRFTREE